MSTAFEDRSVAEPTLSPSSHEPLQLTVELASNVAMGGPSINGEGIIQRLALIDAFGRDYLTLGAEADREEPKDFRDDDRVESGLTYTEGVAHASVGMLDTDKRTTTQYASSYDEVQAHTVTGSRIRRKIPTTMGTFKSNLREVVYAPATRCTFYLHGDLDRLQELFDQHFLWLGTDTAGGFGQVSDYGFRQLDADFSLMHPTEGTAMRPIPTALLADYDDAVEMTWRCPYWYDEWATTCAPVGAEVELSW